ncbi:YciI family protein [Brachybacterium sp. DNPG3]
MALFAVQYTYADDAERIAVFRPEHRAHLAELHDDGVLAASGPLDDGGRALLLITADSAEAALAALDGDPLKRERLIADRTAEEWKVVIGQVG